MARLFEFFRDPASSADASGVSDPVAAPIAPTTPHRRQTKAECPGAPQEAQRYSSPNDIGLLSRRYRSCPESDSLLEYHLDFLEALVTPSKKDKHDFEVKDKEYNERFRRELASAWYFHIYER
jgi:hypothetical protein